MELLAEGLRFPEGPIWSIQDHCLYLVEWHGDSILVLRDGVLETLFQTEKGGGPSGLCQDASGNLWACLYDSRKVVCYNLSGELLHVIQDFDGLPFRGPCDVASDQSGGIYFTDSGDFEQDWRTGRPVGAVYYRSPAGELHLIDLDLCFPNGIVMSEDEEMLYVNEHRQNRTLEYPLFRGDTELGRVILHAFSSKSLLPEESAFELGPDGLCIGSDGELWVAHYGAGEVIRLDPNGVILDVLTLPRGRLTTNVAYCPSENSLYITDAEFGLLYRAQIPD
jgi:gluconolactonase